MTFHVKEHQVTFLYVIRVFKNTDTLLVSSRLGCRDYRVSVKLFIQRVFRLVSRTARRNDAEKYFRDIEIRFD